MVRSHGYAARAKASNLSSTPNGASRCSTCALSTGVLFPKLNERPSETADQFEQDAELIIKTISETGKLRANVLNLSDLKGLPALETEIQG